MFFFLVEETQPREPTTRVKIKITKLGIDFSFWERRHSLRAVIYVSKEADKVLVLGEETQPRRARSWGR